MEPKTMETKQIARKPAAERANQWVTDNYRKYGQHRAEGFVTDQIRTGHPLLRLYQDEGFVCFFDRFYDETRAFENVMAEAVKEACVDVEQRVGVEIEQRAPLTFPLGRKLDVDGRRTLMPGQPGYAWVDGYEMVVRLPPKYGDDAPQDLLRIGVNLCTNWITIDAGHGARSWRAVDYGLDKNDEPVLDQEMKTGIDMLLAEVERILHPMLTLITEGWSFDLRKKEV